jgi:hypothetical protein
MKISVSDPAILQQVVSQAPQPCPKRVLGKEQKIGLTSCVKPKNEAKEEKMLIYRGKTCKKRGNISSAFCM